MLKVYNLVHALPPPFGGVAVHVDRLQKRLLLDNIDATACVLKPHSNVSSGVRVCTASRCANYFWILKEGLRITTDIFHAHSAFALSFPTLMMSYRARGVVFTFHDQMIAERLSNSRWLERKSLFYLFARPNFRAIAVSSAVKQAVIDIGMDANRIFVIPAFLPPCISDAMKLPERIERFLSSHSPVLSVYGYKYEIKDGIDLYGFDMALALLKRLVNSYSQIGLVIIIPGANSNTENITMLQKHADDLGLKDNVLFVTEGSESNVLIFAKSSVYLRPTTTDGDALAVREALAFGTPVVASDAAFRPEAVTLFRNRDAEDFERAVHSVLRELPIIRRRVAENPPVDNYFAVLGVYKDLLK